MFRQTVTALACAVVVVCGLAGCGTTPQAPGEQPGDAAAPTAPEHTTTAPTTTPAADATASPAPTAQPTTGAADDTAVDAAAATAAALASTALGGAGSGVTQETLAAIFADLAARVGVPPSNFSVVAAEAVSWSDGSLGCPQPGMMYPQVIVEGFRVVVAVDGREYAYHGDDRGQFVYCENPAG